MTIYRQHPIPFAKPCLLRRIGHVADLIRQTKVQRGCGSLVAVPDVRILARSVGDIKSNGRGGEQREQSVLQRGGFLRHRKAFGRNGSRCDLHCSTTRRWLELVESRYVIDV